MLLVLNEYGLLTLFPQSIVDYLLDTSIIDAWFDLATMVR